MILVVPGFSTLFFFRVCAPGAKKRDTSSSPSININCNGAHAFLGESRVVSDRGVVFLGYYETSVMVPVPFETFPMGIQIAWIFLHQNELYREPWLFKVER